MLLAIDLSPDYFELRLHSRQLSLEVAKLARRRRSLNRSSLLACASLSYALIDLGPGAAVAISGTGGYVAGNIETSSSVAGFVWHAGNRNEIGTPLGGMTYSEAVDVNINCSMARVQRVRANWRSLSVSSDEAIAFLSLRCRSIALAERLAAPLRTALAMR